MINEQQLLSTARAFSRESAGQAVVGLQNGRSKIPIYASPQSIPAICSLASSDGSVGAVCRQFYGGIRERAGQATCPWGIEVDFTRVENPLGQYALFVQRGVDVTLDVSQQQSVRKKPRKEKKAIAAALSRTKLTRFPLPKNEGVLKDFETLIITLLTGRSADAIRTIAHEIQSPVQGALGDALLLNELVKERVVDSANAERIKRMTRNLDMVAQYARRIPLLVTTDLDYNRAQLRRVSLVSSVESVISRLSSYAESRGIELRRHHRARPNVEAVPEHLEMAVHNLVHNAVKYSFKSAGETQFVQVRVDQERECAVVTVENVGPPITDDEIRNEAIFQLGYRGRYSGDRGRQGTGSGMYIANRVARGHGGRITVTSKQLVDHPDTPACLVRMELRWPINSPMHG